MNRIRRSIIGESHSNSSDSPQTKPPPPPSPSMNLKRKPVASTRSRSTTVTQPESREPSPPLTGRRESISVRSTSVKSKESRISQAPVTGLGLRIPNNSDTQLEKVPGDVPPPVTGIRRKPASQDPNSANSATTIIEDSESPEIPQTEDMSLHPPLRPHNPLSLKLNGLSDGEPTPRPPGSPRGKFSNFFGWKGQASSTHSNATSFSEASEVRSPVPPPSPGQVVRSSSFPASFMEYHPKQAVNMANGAPPSPGLSTSFDTSTLTAMVSSLEEELRQISLELTASIKREMDLEDIVDQVQLDNGAGATRRTSDYFSDEGTSSIRLPSDPETRQSVIDKLQRKMEQEKAQIRLDYNNKLQVERRRRKSLEYALGEKDDRQPQTSQGIGPESQGRIKELETALEDSRRRASQEREAKENYEELLAALRSEVRQHQIERDNFRNEVIPRMQARIEGLESEVTKSNKQNYENTRLNQDVYSRKSPTVDTALAQRIDSIAEELSPGVGNRRSINMPSPLNRSGSVRAGLTRSGSVKDRDRQDGTTGAGGAERIQDIKAQRDALHKALKNLLDRQDLHSRLNAKNIQRLEHERDMALKGIRITPKKGNHRGPVRLNSEDQWLRRRAEEVLDPAFQRKEQLKALKEDQIWTNGGSSPP